MTIAFVQFKKATTTGATSITATFDNPTVTGNLLHADTASYCPTQTTPIITDSVGGNSWSVANAGNVFAADWQCMQQYAANITGGASHAVTLTPPASAYLALGVSEISGAARSATLDKAVANTVTSTAQTVSSGTTTQPDEILMGGLAWDSLATDTVTIDSNYTATYDSVGVQPKLATGYRVVSAVGNYSYACTISPSRTGRSMIATYKARLFVPIIGRGPGMALVGSGGLAS